ncbi:MAG: hypothetical protein A2V86_15205 [Deltaproteobacteria bacterium RBG_16_49_23]|nr:MAG: hypothetical protein A2V86_15205 [Deltaproteobacteria bacterium RBG_16_49_23]
MGDPLHEMKGQFLEGHPANAGCPFLLLLPAFVWVYPPLVPPLYSPLNNSPFPLLFKRGREEGALDWGG